MPHPDIEEQPFEPTERQWGEPQRCREFAFLDEWIQLWVMENPKVNPNDKTDHSCLSRLPCLRSGQYGCRRSQCGVPIFGGK